MNNYTNQLPPINPVIPVMYYRNEFEAKCVADSRAKMLAWWNNNNREHPFNQVVAERIDDQPNACILRVRLEAQLKNIKIQEIFEQAAIKCNNLPPKNIIEFIHANLDKVYEIEGRSYRVLKLISDQGCFGDVFLACDQQSENLVVIKILRDSADREHLMFKRMQQHGNHPNIVQYIGSATLMDKTWIVMEYIRGEMFGQYKSPWTTELKEQHESALQFLRIAGVDSERENDRENVLITFVDGKPVLKLIDFGTLAKK